MAKLYYNCPGGAFGGGARNPNGRACSGMASP